MHIVITAHTYVSLCVHVFYVSVCIILNILIYWFLNIIGRADHHFSLIYPALEGLDIVKNQCMLASVRNDGF